MSVHSHLHPGECAHMSIELQRYGGKEPLCLMSFLSCYRLASATRLPRLAKHLERVERNQTRPLPLADEGI